MLRKGYIILLITGLTAQYAVSQNKDVATNNNIWLSVIENYKFKNDFGVAVETHIRRANYGSDMQQLLIRPYAYYRGKDGIEWSFGYTYIETYPYGEQPVKVKTPENNIWFQALVSNNLAQAKIKHRYRLEERWIGNMEIRGAEAVVTNYVHHNRFRYRITMTKPFRRGSLLYLEFFNELWINFGDHVALNLFDQNWSYFGIGYNIFDQISLSGGYLWQFINKANALQQESNNTIQIALKYNIKNNINE